MAISNILAKSRIGISAFPEKVISFSKNLMKRTKDAAFKVLSNIKRLFEWLKCNIFKIKKKVSPPSIKLSESDGPAPKSKMKKNLLLGLFLVSLLGVGIAYQKGMFSFLLSPKQRHFARINSYKAPTRLGDKELLEAYEKDSEFLNFFSQWKKKMSKDSGIFGGINFNSLLRNEKENKQRAVRDFVATRILGIFNLNDLDSTQSCNKTVTDIYRPISKMIHPDKNPENTELAQEAFKKLGAASDWLRKDAASLCQNL